MGHENKALRGLRLVGHIRNRSQNIGSTKGTLPVAQCPPSRARLIGKDHVRDGDHHDDECGDAEEFRHSATGDEPLFLTEDGRPFTAAGWNGMARRLQRRIAAEGVAFKQHRLRSTRARQLHEAGWSDTAMEALGWKSLPMLRRYLGTIPLSRLKQCPMTLDGVFGKAS